MIIWLNGAFGAGKTSLAEEIINRRPDLILYDPELLGFALREYVPPPTGDFQDLPEWRHLVAETAVVLRRHRNTMLVVPMTIVDPGYRAEIFGAIQASGESVAHYFLDVPAAELRRRIEGQVIHQDNGERDAQARNWRLAQVGRGVAAAGQLSADTVRVAVGGQSVSELADTVLADVDRRGELLDTEGQSC
ncbi:AAA family ATPase [Streptomyces sp. bgisy034]|uniref:AAA family ATPase n=1 Tax=Streptomyces sp. bgisy034 TaxID=3413774 RepID=UPI003EB6D08F